MVVQEERHGGAEGSRQIWILQCVFFIDYRPTGEKQNW